MKSKALVKSSSMVFLSVCLGVSLSGCGSKTDSRATYAPLPKASVSFTDDSSSSSPTSGESDSSSISSGSSSSSSSSSNEESEIALKKEAADVKKQLKSFMSVKNPLERRVLQVDTDNGTVNVYVKISFNNDDFSTVFDEVKEKYKDGPGSINLVRVRYSKDELNELSKKISEQRADLSEKYRVKIADIQLPIRPADYLTVDIDSNTADFDLLSKRFTQIAGGEVRAQPLRLDK